MNINFLGEFRTSVTSGNRIAIPKLFREKIGDSEIILTRGYEGCALLVKKDEFQELLQGISDVPFISVDKRETTRFLLGGAHEVTMDGQGRVVVPESLQEHATLQSGEVVFLGLGGWIEIWDKDRWTEYQEELDAESSEIADRLASLQKE